MQPPKEEIAPEVDTPIAELFARDPFDHTKQSVQLMVDHFRKMRHRFKAGDKAAGSTKPPSKKKLAEQAAMKLADGGALDDIL